MTEIIYPKLSYAVQGAYMDTFRELGSHHPEAFCEEALAIRLAQLGLPYERQKEYKVFYKDVWVGTSLIDLVVDDRILLELKVGPALTPLNVAQVISYLKVTNYQLGILLNFGGEQFEYQRIPNYVSARSSQTPAEVPHINNPNLLYPERVYRILGALFEVHRGLGPGFFHHVYRRATWHEFDLRGLPFTYHKTFEVTAFGEVIGEQDCRVFAVDDKILVATVALREVDGVQRRQFRYYLQSFGLEIGVLANFHDLRLSYEIIRI